MKIKCNCPCKGQDALHGAGTRIGNKTSKPDTFRCSGCGKEHKATAK